MNVYTLTRAAWAPIKKILKLENNFRAELGRRSFLVPLNATPENRRELVMMQQEINDNRPFSTSAISYSTALLANLDPQTSTNHNACRGNSLLLSPAASGAKQAGIPSTVRRTLPNDDNYHGRDHVFYSATLKGASG